MAIVTVDTETCFAALAWTGVEPIFFAGFKAEAVTDIEVWSRNAAGLDTLLTAGLHYSVALASDGAVSVTPIAFPPAPKTILIVRDTSGLQGTVFRNLSSYSADAHQVLHSRAAMRDSEDKFHRDRALLAPMGELLLDIPRATTRAGKVLGFDGVGQPIATVGGQGGSAVINIEMVIDGAGLPITSGVKGDLQISFGATILRSTLLANQQGSIVIDIWKDSYANFPPTVGDTIIGAGGIKPTLNNEIKSQDGTLANWNKIITPGDTLRFNVEPGIVNIQRVTLSLECLKD